MVKKAPSQRQKTNQFEYQLIVVLTVVVIVGGELRG